MSARTDAATWRKQVIGLLQAMDADELPVPIGLGWNPYRRNLDVQVREGDYRVWMEAITSPVLESVPQYGKGTTHLYATGELRRCRMTSVHVVTVAHTVGELPEVGAR